MDNGRTQILELARHNSSFPLFPGLARSATALEPDRHLDLASWRLPDRGRDHSGSCAVWPRQGRSALTLSRLVLLAPYDRAGLRRAGAHLGLQRSGLDEPVGFSRKPRTR